MGDLTRVREWIEGGKQVGKSIFSGEEDGKYLLSIGVQKWEGEYKLYFFKADESRMADLDYYDAEGVIRVTHFEALSNLISILSPFKLSELTPLKGQKIFNPAFD
ncbi:hypothetical protein [Hymenobacter bucti]|uniref:Uncharacterized protein n=1 Tax=Hymenobacter bucti TaxID=1844114 RepID=A0ABW4QSN3_9BACT